MMSASPAVQQLLRGGSYLSLPAGRAIRNFRGIRSFLWRPALHGVPDCQEVQEGPEGLGYCCGTCCWGFDSITSWPESFVLQQQGEEKARTLQTTSWKPRGRDFKIHVRRGKMCSTYLGLTVRKPVWQWIASCSEEQSRPGCRQAGFKIGKQ